MSRATARVLALRAVFTTVGSVAPEAAARWAESIFCTPPRHVPRSEDDAYLATGRRFTVRWEGQELAAWTWGDGPAVILAHGWGSRAARFSAMANALSASGYRVIAYDAPAHGQSTGRFASLPEFARALRAVADAAGPAYGLVGHSLGGAALAVALSDGLAAERVVLLAAPSDVVRFSTVFADQLRLSPRTRAAMRRNLEQRLRARWEDLHLPTIARSLGEKALIIHDRGDRDIPYDQAVEIADAWPGARLVATSGLGHRGILRDAAVIGEAVGFFAATPRR